MTLAGSTFVCTFVVILSDNPFAFDTPLKYFCLQHSTAIILIVILPGSVCLDNPFNFGISWHFC